MKNTVRLIVVLIAVTVLFCGFPWLENNFEYQAQKATAGVFVDKTLVCSGVAISEELVLTARHCVVDENNNFFPEETVSFADNEAGPFYDTRLVAVSQTDDIAILQLINGENEYVLIGDEHLRAGDKVFNISYPNSLGKLKFYGRFVAPMFSHRPANLSRYRWEYTMPVDITIASGSSGSGIFSPSEKALIGIAVGSSREGGLIIVVPVSRLKELLLHIMENTPEEYRKKFPLTEPSEFDILFN